MNEKLKAVMADEAFVKSCIEAENEAAVQQLFADQGIEMSLTEIELMKEMIGAVADGRITGEQLEKLSQAEELSEEELAEVAGGEYGALLGIAGLISLSMVYPIMTVLDDHDIPATKSVVSAYNWCKDKITSRW